MKTNEPNPKILQKLRDGFDARKLEAAVHAIDRLAALRDPLYVVYAKALGLLDGIQNPAADTDKRPVWEVADELMNSVGENVETIRHLELDLEQLVWLNPKLEADDLP